MLCVFIGVFNGVFPVGFLSFISSLFYKGKRSVYFGILCIAEGQCVEFLDSWG